ncbi:MAG TPA: amino acid ABC transporter permease [Bdellovibrionota bacterium]|jgi:polar amino acid transport system permease protein|nr:amino acid ABC transporter permease [Bdellovibrionota bacterium]
MPSIKSPRARALLTFALAATLGTLAFSLAVRKAPAPIGPRADVFMTGARVTLELTLISGVLGLVVGTLVALARLQKSAFAQWPARAYIWLIRGTPLLVQILFVYFALPTLIPSLRLGEFSAAALGLALNTAAYNAESIRAGILAIPKEQVEASWSLGLSRRQTFRWVVLPQAMRIMVPPLFNNLAGLLKDSALASSIGLLELTLAGNRISSETFQPVPVLTTVAVMYLFLTTLLSGLTRAMEQGTWRPA